MSNADAHQRAAAWLRDLEAALVRSDVPAVLALFADDECFWRDMVAFTWNIKTMEGKEQIAAFLSATLAGTEPRNFRVEGEAREVDGVTEARFTFETKAARGRGFLRLKDGRAWTFLTVAQALKGFEEKCWPRPREGRRARRAPGPHDLARAPDGGRSVARLHAAALLPDHRRRPGWTGARRAAAAPRCPDPHRRAQRARRRQLAQSLQVALPARSGLVRPHAVPAVPGSLAGVLAQGQDRRLAGDVRQDHGAELLDVDGMQERAATTTPARNGPWSSTAPASASPCAPSSWCWRPACRACRRCRSFPGADRFRGEQCHSSKFASGAGLRGQALRHHRLEQLRARHLRRPVGARRRRDDGAALADRGGTLGIADGAGARARSIPSRRWPTASPPTSPTSRSRHCRTASHRAGPPRSTRRSCAATATSTTGSTRWAFSTISARTAPASMPSTCAAARATTSTSAPASWWPTAASSSRAG